LRQIFPNGSANTGRYSSPALRHILRPTFGHDSATHVAAIRPHVDDPIRTLDHIQIVLDHQDRIPHVRQPIQHIQQIMNVRKVQPSGRLIQNVKRMPGGRLAQFRSQLHPLRLAA